MDDLSEMALIGILIVIALLGVSVLIGVPAWLIMKIVKRRRVMHPQDEGGEVIMSDDQGATENKENILNDKKDGAPIQTIVINKGSRFADSESLIRFIIVAIIGLFMLIPLSLIDDQANDRSDMHDQALADVGSAWGGEQTIGAGSLIIPVTKTERQVSRSDAEGEKVTLTPVKDSIIVLPRSLSVSAKMNSEIRKKGIYEVVVYSAPLEVKGDFSLKGVRALLAGRNDITVHWDQAYFSFGVSRAASLREVQPLTFNGQSVNFAPGSRNAQLFEQGFHAPLGGENPLLSPNQTDYSFAVSITLKGTGGLSFMPLGESNRFHVDSGWPHPSFLGEGLPDEKTITDQGFSASWSIPSLTRSYQQVTWSSAWSTRSTEGMVSVHLFEPVKLYGEITRATHYGILFIALTFALFLANELRSTKERLHPVQYGMVGLAMASFYLLLLALAEHIPFAVAYVLSSVVAIAMNSVYVGYIVASKEKGIRLALGLSLLHGMLFVVLRMEDYSLLMGTFLVMATLGLLMHSTRHLGKAG